MPKTFTFNPAQDVLAARWPQPSIGINVEWKKASSGGFAPIVRNVTGDIHECKLKAFGTRDQVEALRSFLDDRADALIDLVEIQTPLFCPLIDHSADLSVFVTPTTTDQTAFVQDEGGFYTLALTLRAVQYSFKSVSGSLDSLRQRAKFQPGADFVVAPRWSYVNVPSLADPLASEGLFTEEFYQSEAETAQILKYLLVDTRGQSFAFPSLAGVTYPFGISHGALPKRCHAVSVAISRANRLFWLIKISFAEAFK